MNEAYWPPPLNASAVTSHPVSILLFSCQRAHGRTRRSAATHSCFGTPCAPKPSTLLCLARCAKQRTVHVAQNNVHDPSYLCVHDAPLHGDSWPHELRTLTVYSQEKCRSRKPALKMGCKFLHHYNRGARLCAFGTYGSPARLSASLRSPIRRASCPLGAAQCPSYNVGENAQKASILFAIQEQIGEN